LFVDAGKYAPFERPPTGDNAEFGREFFGCFAYLCPINVGEQVEKVRAIFVCGEVAPSSGPRVDLETA
jgi:hypothetical protein